MRHSNRFVVVVVVVVVGCCFDFSNSSRHEISMHE